jgi:hypothetical protein
MCRQGCHAYQCFATCYNSLYLLECALIVFYLDSVADDGRTSSAGLCPCDLHCTGIACLSCLHSFDLARALDDGERVLIGPLAPATVISGANSEYSFYTGAQVPHICSRRRVGWLDTLPPRVSFLL